jgi:hypothetical protein
LLYTGELGEPWGTPLFVGATCPCSQLPTFSVCLLHFRILPSALRWGLSFLSLPCGILGKEDLKSIATTPQACLYRSSRIASVACPASRFGLMKFDDQNR